jgi:tetratricopeptide (TPR) repeat protein
MTADLDFELIHRLNAVIGWVELGNLAEAKEELNQIPASGRAAPEVLEARWLLEAHMADWKGALKTAEEILRLAPNKSAGWLHRAYALRRVKRGGLKEAAESLRPAFDKFPKEPTIPYNLACYACQLGKLEEARKWFAEALKRSRQKTKIKKMAVNDVDLKPLWEEIRKLR